MTVTTIVAGLIAVLEPYSVAVAVPMGATRSAVESQVSLTEDVALARIMHDAERFRISDRGSRAGDPSVWRGVMPLAVQHVWD